jgi:hypothetical protein
MLASAFCWRAACFRRGGNHPRPGLPLGGNGKGDQIPCCRRLICRGKTSARCSRLRLCFGLFLAIGLPRCVVHPHVLLGRVGFHQSRTAYLVASSIIVTKFIGWPSILQPRMHAGVPLHQLARTCPPCSAWVSCCPFCRRSELHRLFYGRGSVTSFRAATREGVDASGTLCGPPESRAPGHRGGLLR